MHANIDAYSRIFIDDFLIDEIKCIGNLQSHCANMNFAEKVDMGGLFKKSHIKEGNMQLITLNIAECTCFISLSTKQLF